MVDVYSPGIENKPMESCYYLGRWFTILGLIMYYVLDNGVVIGSYKYLKDAKEVSKGMYEIFYSLR